MDTDIQRFGLFCQDELSPSSTVGEIVVGFLICGGIFFQNEAKIICILQRMKSNRIILAAKITANKGKFQGREFPYLSVSGPDLKLQTGGFSHPEQEARLLVIQLILLFLSQEGLDLLIKCCEYASEVTEKKNLFPERFWPRL